jgi:hypothetical protein
MSEKNFRQSHYYVWWDARAVKLNPIFVATCVSVKCRRFYEALVIMSSPSLIRLAKHTKVI